MKKHTDALRLLLRAAGLVGLAGLAAATDLNLRIQSAGSSNVTVAPGQSLRYYVTGVLSDGASHGLAMYAFDLAFDGGALPQADAPSAAPMTNFATPLGINNPTGFGGTPVGGRLVQVGGAQNTIQNHFAPRPTGTVIPDLAQPTHRVLLVTGTLTAPTTPGTYTLVAENLFANVIRAGETGTPFWAVEAAAAGTNEPLTIQVLDCNVTTYCSAKQNSQGCLPAISWTGTPTLGGADDFHLRATNVINNQFGLVFWGASSDNAPFMGGTRCVALPVVRSANQPSGGNPPPADCSGALDFFFSHAYMNAHGLGVGDPVRAQFWFRDPSHPDGTGVGLSNAAQFTICP